MQPLRLTTVQTHLAWEDPLQNRHHLTQLLAPLSGSTDVVVLPEMFTTGFSMRPAPLAESMDGPTLTWMREQASELQSALVGSLIIEEGGHYYNRLCWVDPDGPLATYDKRHRFTLAGEHEHYRAGQSRTIIPYRGWRILPLICYDLRFPVWSRNAGDYDLLLYVANWPDARSAAWRSLLMARAIENQAYTVGVNRIGTDGNGHSYRGDSGVVDYRGEWLAQASHVEAVTTLTLDPAAQQQFRERLNFLDDRDQFTIHY